VSFLEVESGAQLPAFTSVLGRHDQPVKHSALGVAAGQSRRVPPHRKPPGTLHGHVVIEVKAFGINHAEMHMRRGEWAEAAPVSGIECVGLVKAAPGGGFPVGAKVAALMGGLGRTINGS
jgi:NADPH:quinone reductase-like Zn-dependent oxidoreductase